jgi:hypothetical protein
MFDYNWNAPGGTKLSDILKEYYQPKSIKPIGMSTSWLGPKNSRSLNVSTRFLNFNNMLPKIRKTLKDQVTKFQYEYNTEGICPDAPGLRATPARIEQKIKDVLELFESWCSANGNLAEILVSQESLALGYNDNTDSNDRLDPENFDYPLFGDELPSSDDSGVYIAGEDMKFSLEALAEVNPTTTDNPLGIELSIAQSAQLYEMVAQDPSILELLNDIDYESLC